VQQTLSDTIVKDLVHPVSISGGEEGHYLTERNPDLGLDWCGISRRSVTGVREPSPLESCLFPLPACAWSVCRRWPVEGQQLFVDHG
jgi:hypothetical protein